MGEAFGRVPKSILRDTRLSHADVRVYGALASWAIGSGAVVKRGVRTIAEESAVSLRMVPGCLKALEAAGHLKRYPGENGMRAYYVLTSPIFRPKADRDEVVYAENGVTVTRKRGAARLAKVG